jgi:LysM repeat protein
VIKRFAGVLAVVIAFAMGVIIARMSIPYLPDEAAAFLQTAVAGTKTAIPPTINPNQNQVATAAATNPPAATPTRPTVTPTTPKTATPLASFTPSKTLLPPPTLEPPTNTPPPSPVPSLTPTFTPFLQVDVPGLNSGSTATPVSTPGCVPRKDWKLTYTVQPLDALTNIAGKYGISVDELAQGNCISNKNLIQNGQVLKVPGTAQPETRWTCTPIQNLTPQDGTQAIAGSGSLTFHWYGPRTPKNLIRVFAPDGTKIEYVVELRQDYVVDLFKDMKQAGWYTWYVYPLDDAFRGVCSEGGPWKFLKQPAPTNTPPAVIK